MAQLYCNPVNDSILEEDVTEDVENSHIQGKVHTHGTVDNATAHTVAFVACHFWAGESTPDIFPKQIKVLNSGEFDHTGTRIGSSAAVVYRGKNKAQKDCDWILAWSNPSKLLTVPKHNRVYTEIRHPGHYTQDVWNKIFAKLQNSKDHVTVKWNGCVSTVKLNDNEFEATLGLDDNVA